MFTSFWKLRTEEAERLRSYMCSSLYRPTKNENYRESEYWASLAGRTFTAINGDVVMLHSGHAFVEPIDVRSGRLAFRCARNAVVRVLVGSDVLWGLADRLCAFIGRCLRAADELRSRGKARLAIVGLGTSAGQETAGFKLPEIMSEAVAYNQTKVYDSIENVSLLEKVLSGNLPRPVFLEIGAGAGLTSLLLRERISNSRVVICDLPVTICVGYTLVSRFARSREFKVLLPNEVGADVLRRHLYDIAFITPDQADLLESDSIDGVINVHSMQEMKMETITGYFKLIYRVAKNGAFFFCKNLEVSKQYSDTRFDEYPWDLVGVTYFDGVAQYASSLHADRRCPVRVRIVRVEKR